MTEVLSAGGVAALMGVSKRWVWESLAAGELPGRKVGSRWFIPRDVLEAFLSISDAPPKERRHHRKKRRHAGDEAFLELLGGKKEPPHSGDETIRKLFKNVDVAPEEPKGDFDGFFADPKPQGDAP